MKKVTLCALAASVCMSIFSTSVVAQFVGPSGGQSGYTGPSATTAVKTVSDILQRGVDDQRVVVRGRIVRHLSGDKYTFTDGTGEITVDIDAHEFPGQPVNESTLVEINAKIDTDFGKPNSLDAKQVRIVKN